ncbi:hypothetical protein B0H13DRAFT_2240860 [Mycena leptocephala]|nr:hypothetical protein B0H13DRAFT_2240860 [Mycena leptocephala]
MDHTRRVSHGSYIWGWRVHNKHIERLWYDVTHSFGQKWKKFFTILEVHNGLNSQVPAHIWLLHHLFLHHINADAQDMLQDSPHRLEHWIEPAEESVDNLDTYGIDWDMANDPALMNHLLNQNPQDWVSRNPFALGLDSLSHVPCDAPNCPFTPEEVHYFDQQLAVRVDILWIAAMEICNELYP